MIEERMRMLQSVTDTITRTYVTVLNCEVLRVATVFATNLKLCDQGFVGLCSDAAL